MRMLSLPTWMVSMSISSLDALRWPLPEVLVDAALSHGDDYIRLDLARDMRHP